MTRIIWQMIKDKVRIFTLCYYNYVFCSVGIAYFGWRPYVVIFQVSLIGEIDQVANAQPEVDAEALSQFY